MKQCNKCGFKGEEFKYCPDCGTEVIVTIEDRVGVLEAKVNRLEIGGKPERPLKPLPPSVKPEAKDYPTTLPLKRHKQPSIEQKYDLLVQFIRNNPGKEFYLTTALKESSGSLGAMSPIMRGLLDNKPHHGIEVICKGKNRNHVILRTIRGNYSKKRIIRYRSPEQKDKQFKMLRWLTTKSNELKVQHPTWSMKEIRGEAGRLWKVEKDKEKGLEEKGIYMHQKHPKPVLDGVGNVPLPAEGRISNPTDIAQREALARESIDSIPAYFPVFSSVSKEHEAVLQGLIKDVVFGGRELNYPAYSHCFGVDKGIEGYISFLKEFIGKSKAVGEYFGIKDKFVIRNNCLSYKRSVEVNNDGK